MPDTTEGRVVRVGDAQFIRRGAGWRTHNTARSVAVGPLFCAMLDRIAELEDLYEANHG